MEHPELVKYMHSERSADRKALMTFVAGLIVGLVAMLVFSLPVQAAEPSEGPYAAVEIADWEFDEWRTILALEAQTEGYTGLQCCAEVCLNRVISADPYWPDTMHGVLSQGNGAQFVSWKRIHNPYNIPGELEDDAISSVLDGESGIQPYLEAAQARGEVPGWVKATDYIFFSRGKSKYGKYWIKIGRHQFGVDRHLKES